MSTGEFILFLEVLHNLQSELSSDRNLLIFPRTTQLPEHLDCVQSSQRVSIYKRTFISLFI
jgi:hypothetical protein